MEIIVNNTEKFKKELFNQIMEAGDHTAAESIDLVKLKLKYEHEANKFRRNIKVPKMIPADLIPDGIIKSKDFNEILYNTGFDTVESSWVYDVCCYTWEGKVKCGLVILGEERLDKTWGRSGHQSDDAFYFNSRELLKEGLI